MGNKKRRKKKGGGGGGNRVQKEKEKTAKEEGRGKNENPHLLRSAFNEIRISKRSG